MLPRSPDDGLEPVGSSIGAAAGAFSWRFGGATFDADPMGDEGDFTRDDLDGDTSEVDSDPELVESGLAASAIGETSADAASARTAPITRARHMSDRRWASGVSPPLPIPPLTP